MSSGRKSSEADGNQEGSKPSLITFEISGPNVLVDRFNKWMSPLVERNNVIRRSPMVDVEEEEKGNFDWEDVRIQSWTSVERQENNNYIDRLEEYTGNNDLLNVSPCNSLRASNLLCSFPIPNSE